MIVHCSQLSDKLPLERKEKPNYSGIYVSFFAKNQITDYTAFVRTRERERSFVDNELFGKKDEESFESIWTDVMHTYGSNEKKTRVMIYRSFLSQCSYD